MTNNERSVLDAAKLFAARRDAGEDTTDQERILVEAVHALPALMGEAAWSIQFQRSARRC